MLRDQYTRWGKRRFTVVSTSEFILVILIYSFVIFQVSYKPPFAPPYLDSQANSFPWRNLQYAERDGLLRLKPRGWEYLHVKYFPHRSQSLFLPHRDTFSRKTIFTSLVPGHAPYGVRERTERCCVTYTVIDIEEGRCFAAEEKLICSDSNFQKCEPLTSRFRENLDSLERTLPDNCFACQSKRQQLRKGDDMSCMESFPLHFWSAF